MIDLCSLSWDRLPACGTAPRASFWLALEQPGPWGAKAFIESLLDPVVGAALDKACSASGGKALLARRTGAHPAGDGPRRAWVSGGPLSDPWVATGEIDDPAVLLDLPYDLLAEGGVDVVAPFGLKACDPVALVCTNAKRDTCCAVRGRPVALTAAAALPDDVWECSHTGGHRFAPTLVVLPTGQLLAHATADDVVASLRAAGVGRLAVVGHKDRGLSRLAPQLQVAESWIREREGILELAVLSSEVDGDDVTTTHADGRTWRLTVAKETSDLVLPESCGKDGKPVALWSVEPA